MICTVIYDSHQKEIKVINMTSLYAICMIKKLRYSCKILKTVIKLWINTKKVHSVIQFN